MSRPVIIASIILFLGGAFGNYLRFIEQTPDRPVQFSEIPLNVNGYIGDERRFSEESYGILKADTTTLRYYRGPSGEQLWLFIAYFASQKYGSQIHSPKHCLPGGGWNIERLERYALSLPDGKTKQVNRLIIGERDRKQIMFYWFETRNGDIDDEFMLKWDLMKNSLFLKPTDAAIVRLTVPLERNDSIEKATERATAYFANFYPSIEKALPFGD
ncbi:MAG: EpsI family protein [candidate division Zixibacteria bacterium]|nr:EpsI family protein [candidate division Zixibacteria bacterium]